MTGEVLGQRPMSQRRDAMRLIEKEAGLEGLILTASLSSIPSGHPSGEGRMDGSGETFEYPGPIKKTPDEIGRAVRHP